MDSIGDVIKTILEKRGMWLLVKQQEVMVKWPVIAGEQISRNTEAVKIEKGILWIKVKNSVWMHHLALLKPEILKKINHFINKEIVKDLYFFIGEIKGNNNGGEQEKEKAEVCKKRNGFSSEEIKDMLSEVEDDTIKGIIKKIIEKNI